MQEFKMPDSFYDPPDEVDGPEDEVWPACEWCEDDAYGEGTYPDLCGPCGAEAHAMDRADEQREELKLGL